MNEATKVRKLPTGVPGLDIITHGGIPEGRSVLVTGRSGTGSGGSASTGGSRTASPSGATSPRRGGTTARGSRP